MKKYTYIAILIVCFFLYSDIQAQGQKFGYVNTDMILSELPEYQNVEKELGLVSQQWRDQLKAMQQEIDNLKEDFSSKEILYTEEIRKQKEEEIKSKVEQRQQFLEQKFGSNGEYFQKQQELLEPIQRKVYEAISVVAERDNFDFIFDRSQGNTLIYSNSEWNLNNKVLLELGISIDETGN
ncbi:MAG: OmpH family outer membrane protein [Balneolaceae bacterium]|nr:OmpH family outer membrane protein [Balneolaceae bacterium]